MKRKQWWTLSDPMTGYIVSGMCDNSVLASLLAFNVGSRSFQFVHSILIFMQSIGCDVGWAWARHWFWTNGWMGGWCRTHGKANIPYYDIFVNDLSTMHGKICNDHALFHFAERAWRVHHATDHRPPMILLRINDVLEIYICPVALLLINLVYIFFMFIWLI